MAAQFNRIAERYQKARTLINTYIVSSFIDVLGNVREKSVLDLACGEGRFTRMAKQRGASNALGIDISEKMIDLARQEEAKNPLGIKYEVGDALKLQKLDEFDVVMAICLLHYAKTEQEIITMCRNIYKNLRADGTLVAVLRNPKNPLYNLKKYGSVASAKLPLHEGDTITVRLYANGKKLCSFKNYHWKMETYNRALREAGFRNMEWQICKMTKEGIAKFGKKVEEKYMENPGFVILTCKK